MARCFRPLDRFQRVQPTRLSDKAVALIVKRRAKAVRAGSCALRRALAAGWAGHFSGRGGVL